MLIDILKAKSKIVLKQSKVSVVSYLSMAILFNLYAHSICLAEESLSPDRITEALAPEETDFVLLKEEAFYPDQITEALAPEETDFVPLKEESFYPDQITEALAPDEINLAPLKEEAFSPDQITEALAPDEINLAPLKEEAFSPVQITEALAPEEIDFVLLKEEIAEKPAGIVDTTPKELATTKNLNSTICEFRISYFRPFSKTLRKLTGGGAYYGLEATIPFWKGLNVWGRGRLFFQRRQDDRHSPLSTPYYGPHYFRS